MSNEGVYKFNVFGFKLIVYYNNGIVGIHLLDSMDKLKYLNYNEYLILNKEWKDIINHTVIFDFINRDFKLMIEYYSTATLQLNLENIYLLKFNNYEIQIISTFNNIYTLT